MGAKWKGDYSMDKMDFKAFMEENDFKVEKRLAYGSKKGYPILMKKQWGKKVELSIYLEEKPWSIIREQILEFARLYRSETYYENDHLVWKTEIGRKEYYRFQEMLNGIIRILEKNQVSPPDTCVICGEKQIDSYAVINEGNQPVHRECLQKELEAAREEMQQGRYLNGLLGGLLGCLLGCIPCLLSLLIAGKTYCVLFLFIPPSIYMVCKKMNGKMNGIVFWETVFFSFLSVYVLGFAVRIQYNLELQNLPATPYYCMAVWGGLLKCKGIFGIITKDSMLNFLFVLMGILIDWEMISRTSLQAEQNIVKVIETINYKKKEE